MVNEELLALLNLELLTVNFYNCVHYFNNINGFFRQAVDFLSTLVQARTD
jgi:hypothetical protein